jgi:hypothetical protein
MEPHGESDSIVQDWSVCAARLCNGLCANCMPARRLHVNKLKMTQVPDWRLELRIHLREPVRQALAFNQGGFKIYLTRVPGRFELDLGLSQCFYEAAI